MKRTLIVVAMALFGLAPFGSAAEPQTFTLTVDVGSPASVGMGPGGMGGNLSTGGGPVSFGGQEIGVFMHTTQSAMMQGMMGQTQSFQHRVMTFDFPGAGTLFVMMAGGNPWTGATGIIMGGTGLAQGISGTVMVGNQAGPNRYPFVFTLSP